jgi:hypothetical protein
MSTLAKNSKGSCMSYYLLGREALALPEPTFVHHFHSRPARPSNVRQNLEEISLSPLISSGIQALAVFCWNASVGIAQRVPSIHPPYQFTSSIMKVKQPHYRHSLKKAFFLVLTASSCLIGNSAANPVISEFVAVNTNGLQDEDGEYSDWIEFYNPTASAIDLGGYYLTDKADNLTKWQIPAVSLEPGRAMIVYASEKRRTDPAKNVHTNFKLSIEGEYLALVDKDGTTKLQEFAPAFPKQFADTSYGLMGSTAAGSIGYFQPPSPGAVNGDSFQNPIPLVQFSHTSQTFTEPFALTVSGAKPGQTIRFQTNEIERGAADEPDKTSPVYNEPISVEKSSEKTLQVRARVFDVDGTPGETTSATFIFLEEEDATSSDRYIGTTVRKFTSDLPIVVLDDFDRGRPGSNREMHMSIYEPKGEGEIKRASMMNMPDLETRGNMRQRGSSTGGWQKYSLAIEFWDEVDEDRNLSVLGLPSESDWVLSGRWEFDRALMRNPFMYELSRRIGRYAPRTRFVEVFSNTDDGILEARDYMGVYALMEKIKRGPDRVDVERLAATDNTEPAITGGYMFKKDRLDPGDRGLNVRSMGSLGWIYPKEDDVSDEQDDYLTNYLNEFDKAVRNTTEYTNPDNGKHYSEYIDVGSWIDEHLLRILSKDPDALRLSTYLFKPRGGKVHYGPIWDFDRCLGCDTDSRALSPTSFSNNDFWNYAWWNNLIWKPGRNGAPPTERDRGDPDFNQAYIDRYFSLRETHFTEDSFNIIIDEMASQMREAQERNFSRWSDRRPNGGRYDDDLDGWEGEVQHLKGWLRERVHFMDQQWLPVATFNQEGGVVESGFELSMSSPKGAVYYTLDGTDPRASGGVPGGTLFPGGPVTNNYVASFVPSKYLVPTDGALGDTWTAVDLDDSAWTEGTTGLGFETAGAAALEFIKTNLAEQMKGVSASAYVRTEFDFNNQPSNVNSMTLKVKYDDGFVAYLNGFEIARANAPDTVAWDSEASGSHKDSQAVIFENFDIADGKTIMRQGRNVLAIQGMNTSIGGSDFLILPEFNINETITPEPLPLTKSALVTTRSTEEAHDRLYWSPPKSVYFLIGEDRGSAANLVVSEMMYHPAKPSDSEKAAGLTNRDEFEWLELQNISDRNVSLFESSFAAGIGFDFSSAEIVSIAPGAVVLLVSNKEAFEMRHGTGLPVASTYTGRLGNNGEQLRLNDYAGEPIKDFTYDDAAPWPETADGDGFSLELVRPAANPDHNNPASWTASATDGGTPGIGIGGPPPTGDDDADGDGVPDDVELAMGTDPANANSFATPEAGVAGFSVGAVDADYLFFGFQKTAAGVLSNYVVETTPDLENWKPAGDDLVLVSEVPAGEGLSTALYRSATAFETQEQSLLFMRLRVKVD